PARAERLVTLAGQDDDSDRLVLAGDRERSGDLDQRLRPECVVHFRPADGDLGDAVGGGFVPDIGVVAGCGPANVSADSHSDILPRVRSALAGRPRGMAGRT